MWPQGNSGYLTGQGPADEREVKIRQLEAENSMLKELKVGGTEGQETMIRRFVAENSALKELNAKLSAAEKEKSRSMEKLIKVAETNKNRTEYWKQKSERLLWSHNRLGSKCIELEEKLSETQEERDTEKKRRRESEMLENVEASIKRINNLKEDFALKEREWNEKFEKKAEEVRSLKRELATSERSKAEIHKIARNTVNEMEKLKRDSESYRAQINQLKAKSPVVVVNENRSLKNSVEMLKGEIAQLESKTESEKKILKKQLETLKEASDDEMSKLRANIEVIQNEKKAQRNQIEALMILNLGREPEPEVAPLPRNPQKPGAPGDHTQSVSKEKYDKAMECNKKYDWVNKRQQKKISELEGQLEEARKASAGLAENTDTNRKIQKLEERCSELEGEKEKRIEDITTVKDELQSKLAEVERLTERLKFSDERNKQLQAQVQEVAASFASMKNFLGKLNLDKDKLANLVDELQVEKTEGEAKMAELARLTQESCCRQLQEQIKMWDKWKQQKDVEVEELRNDLQETAEKELNERIQVYQNLLKEKDDKLQELSEEFNDAKGSLAGIKSANDFLTVRVQNQEGMLMEQAKMIPEEVESAPDDQDFLDLNQRQGSSMSEVSQEIENNCPNCQLLEKQLLNYKIEVQAGMEKLRNEKETLQNDVDSLNTQSMLFVEKHVQYEREEGNYRTEIASLRHELDRLKVKQNESTTN